MGIQADLLHSQVQVVLVFKSKLYISKLVEAPLGAVPREVVLLAFHPTLSQYGVTM